LTFILLDTKLINVFIHVIKHRGICRVVFSFTEFQRNVWMATLTLHTNTIPYTYLYVVYKMNQIIHY